MIGVMILWRWRLLWDYGGRFGEFTCDGGSGGDERFGCCCSSISSSQLLLTVVEVILRYLRDGVKNSEDYSCSHEHFIIDG